MRLRRSQILPKRHSSLAPTINSPFSNIPIPASSTLGEGCLASTIQAHRLTPAVRPTSDSSQRSPCPQPPLPHRGQGSRLSSKAKLKRWKKARMTAGLLVNPPEAGPVRRTEHHLLRHPEQGAAGVPLWAATNGADREKTIMQVTPYFCFRELFR